MMALAYTLHPAVIRRADLHDALVGPSCWPVGCRAGSGCDFLFSIGPRAGSGRWIFVSGFAWADLNLARPVNDQVFDDICLS